MPTQPPLDGLPPWAQILISILICLATVAVAFKGYFGKNSAEQAGKTNEHTVVTLAQQALVDIGAIRRLSDTVSQLNTTVLALITVVNEQTHHSRNEVDVSRELCGRLRALAEELERASHGRGKF